ncbi:MAG: SocA family protein [Nanoarchaeota archaeon]|nr:SocA family protein [Nanoarchaeota archaeon]
MAINQDIIFDKEKFKQVLHYIVSRVGTLDNVGKTILYKILYFSDFDSYELNEVPITGEKYFKLHHGPAPSDFDNIVEELEREEKIKKIDAKYKGLLQIKFLSLCKPNLNLLNANELQLVEKVINKLSNMSAKQVSSYSHEDMPWKATKDNEEINYELVFYRSPTFSVSEENAQVC